MHDPHHVHLDLDVINTDYTRVGTSSHLRFEEIRNTPFLDGDSSDYFCSIVNSPFKQLTAYRCFMPVVEKNKYPEQNYI